MMHGNLDAYSNDSKINHFDTFESNNINMYNESFLPSIEVNLLQGGDPDELKRIRNDQDYDIFHGDIAGNDWSIDMDKLHNYISIELYV